MKVVIVGGVAGGATAAARLRRLDEGADIILLERGPEVSFANCGLPYYIGGVITDRDEILLHTPKSLADRYRLDVRVGAEVRAIDRTAKQVVVREAGSGREYRLDYDRLLLSPGAFPFRPPFPGADLPGVAVLRDVGDADRLAAAAARGGRAVVAGAGFIGLEAAENLTRRGMKVAVVEAAGQVLRHLDPEMARPVARRMEENGVTVTLNTSVRAASAAGNRLRIGLSDGSESEADLLLLAVGVRPEVALARDAGLDIGTSGGIAVDERMRTSDPSIFAVGDAVEVRHRVLGKPVLLYLAGPANRQARVASDAIMGRDSRYAGGQGTAIIGLFGLQAASTGPSERALRDAGIPYRKAYLHPLNHASYYPGASRLHIKVLFAPDGRILGAQAVGGEGADKRIDVMALAVRAGLTVDDLAEGEFAYAPQFGSARDPVNLAGLVAGNILSRDQVPVYPEEVAGLRGSGAVLLDVRTREENAEGRIPGSLNIPIDELRGRLAEVPSGKPVIAYCRVGLRGYVAARILAQAGYDARNLVGGILTWMDFGFSTENGR